MRSWILSRSSKRVNRVSVEDEVVWASGEIMVVDAATEGAVGVGEDLEEVEGVAVEGIGAGRWRSSFWDLHDKVG